MSPGRSRAAVGAGSSADRLPSATASGRAYLARAAVERGAIPGARPSEAGPAAEPLGASAPLRAPVVASPAPADAGDAVAGRAALTPSERGGDTFVRVAHGSS